MRILAGALALLLVAACGALGREPGVATGAVTGTVVVAPCRPVERVGDPPCPPRPGIKVHFERGSAATVAVTNPDGVYSVRLAAGTYDVWAEGGIGRPQPVRVTVQPGDALTVNLTVDSGIR